MSRAPLAAACALLVALAPSAGAQIFVRNTTDVPNQSPPGPSRFTENVDFGDVDLDGDFDAVFAHGGDFGNLQDRVWINQGGLQEGTVGVFADETAGRFPAIARDGRDVELLDFDGDADLDVYIANTSSLSVQTALWFVNGGGAQPGTLGFYADETSSRWIGIAGPGSSIAPSHVVGGGFIDWACDGDFGDLDNDGDLDLVHSSYGGTFNALVPTRIFLNDGDGHFEEFNRGGFQLTGSTIAEEDPGLWCQGTVEFNTLDTTGVHCDIATDTLDIDLGDVDGDFDLDILHGDRSSPTRFFYNWTEEFGQLSFRDMTAYVYELVAGGDWAPGGGHYEQEMGDFDGDDDLDLFGLNWQATGFNFDDIVAENVGGRFANDAILPGSLSDDNEGDFGDWDNDGDLDLYIGNFSGEDRLYTNDGTGAFSLEGGTGLGDHGQSTNISLDVQWCDVDEDGDYDVFATQDSNLPIAFWENTTQTPDTTAPRVGPVEALGNADASIFGSPDRAVRAHVYDNAPYYLTWYNPTRVNVYRDGELLDTYPARSSGGQVFRAEIPSNLLGNVSYEFVSEDPYGNTGTSAQQAYVATEGALTNQSLYGNAFIGVLGNEYEVHSASLLTPDKPWYVKIDTKGSAQFFYFVVTLDQTSPPVFDPVLKWINVGSQIALQQFGATPASGVRFLRYFIPGYLAGQGITECFAELFVPEPSFTEWSNSRGLQTFFHE